MEHKVVDSSVVGAVVNRAHNVAFNSVTFNTWLESYSVSDKDESQSPEQSRIQQDSM